MDEREEVVETDRQFIERIIPQATLGRLDRQADCVRLVVFLARITDQQLKELTS